MLVDLTINKVEVERILKVCKEHNIPETSLSSHPDNHIETGVYRCGCDFNFGEEEFVETSNLSYEDKYLSMVRTWAEPLDGVDDKIILDMDSQYGVSDNIEQIKAYYRGWFDKPDTKWVIAVTPVFQNKGNKGKGDGWRWHKWGPYIGNLNPMSEYLDDEDFGDEFQGYILCYHIYPVKDKL